MPGEITECLMRCIYYCRSGRDSLRASLPGALRVNANSFQTDLCRNPVHKDVMEYQDE